MCDIRDVIPWSLIYAELNRQHQTELKANALRLLEYLTGCASGWFEDLLEDKLDATSFAHYCWQEVRRNLSAEDIQGWLSQEIERTRNKYGYEDINRRAVDRIKWRTQELLQRLGAQEQDCVQSSALYRSS